MSDPLVELVRGGLVDEIHRGDLAVVAADGELRFRVGHPRDRVAFWRSSAKPFQAMPLIASGAAARLGLEPEDVALMAASHGGEPVHVERVRSLLARTGHHPDELRCGAHEPLDAIVGARARSGGASSRARCTTTARASTPACSPSRISSARQARDTVAGPSGAGRDGGERRPLHRGRPDDLVVGLDGCGVPCFGITVYRMAFAFARLMMPPDEIPVRSATRLAWCGRR